MSYLAYINGHQLELSDSSIIAYTKQVNDLARLDNRQSNFTHKFTVPFTANNKRAMEFVYSVGNQSNVPYQKNVFDLIDADTGKHLIYKGWANINQTSKKGYEINVYDGVIDFYRAIENKTLTDVGIAGLDHAKSITNIIASWSNTMPYMYAISDYNGKNKFTTTAGVDIEINTDYQIPSARVSYIWNQVFAFAGFTYSGSYFATQKFLNLFMTFPKPVPTLVPHRILVHAGSCYPRSSVAWNPNEVGPGIGGWHTYYLQTIPRENFTTPEASVTNNLASTAITGGGAVYNHNYINILTAGTYSIDIPLTVNAMYIRRDSTNTVVESGTVMADPTGTFKTKLFTCNVGDKIGFILTDPELILSGLTFNWELNRIDGYDANFSAALVDFKATDFINEIIQQAGITAFKDKYRNHIEFLTMDEILRSNNIIDWSDKFQYKDVEKYKIGKYAKKNNFKYRYNSENETYNDGAIYINDENLQDEDDVIVSKIYTPERDFVDMIGKQVQVFKIWEKEPQDDSTIKYKDLSGRYYFLRVVTVPASVTLASESLNTQQAVTSLQMASYSGLRFSEIINDNYSSIKSILDKGKIIDTYFNLKTIDFEKFDFKSLIYVEQLASYYLVNKIPSFIKGKITKCEVIEVDYHRMSSIIVPPIATFVTITGIVIEGCNMLITFNTDAVLPALVTISGTRAFLVLPNPDTDYYDNIINATTNTIAVTVPDGGIWSFVLTIGGINSNVISANNFGVCSFTPPAPTLTTLTITSIQTLSIVGGQRNIRVNYTSDLTTGTMHLICSAFNLGAPFNTDFYFATQNGYVDITVANMGLSGVAVWSITLSALGITSNTMTS